MRVKEGRLVVGVKKHERGLEWESLIFSRYKIWYHSTIYEYTWEALFQLSAVSLINIPFITHFILGYTVFFTWVLQSGAWEGKRSWRTRAGDAHFSSIYIWYHSTIYDHAWQALFKFAVSLINMLSHRSFLRIYCLFYHLLFPVLPEKNCCRCSLVCLLPSYCFTKSKSHFFIKTSSDIQCTCPH